MILKPSFSDSPSSFVVYVFRELTRDQRPGKRARLHWQRSAVCPDLASALLRAELIKTDPRIRRVQVFEQILDRHGNLRAGRIVRSWRCSPWTELFRFFEAA